MTEPYFETKLGKLYCGECLETLRPFPSNSVDSVVTDSPYGLKFMGKKWDYDVPGVEIWKECLRVLKPGGFLLSFAGTRTQHRMAVNIEDAGFEIRDMIAWVHGQGFPKALDINKKLNTCICSGNAVPYNHEKTKYDMRPLRVSNISQTVNHETKQREVLQQSLSEQGVLPSERGKESIEGFKNGEESSMEGGELHRTHKGLPDDTSPETSTGKAERVCSGAHHGNGELFGKSLDPERGSSPHQQCQIRQQATEPKTIRYALRPLDGESLSRCSECKRPILSSGYKTAIKPSLEPITVARKPLSESTVAKNVLKWGTGGINIDRSRVGTEPKKINNYKSHGREGCTALGGTHKGDKYSIKETQGRFPANFILTYPENEYMLKEEITIEQKKIALKWIYENA